MSTSSPVDRMQSRLGERVATGTPGTNPPVGANEVSLARVVSVDGRARSWRVTFHRLERSDSRALLHRGDPAESTPAWVSQLYQYTAGAQNLPAVPPRRSEPVLGFNGSADVEPVWAQIAWGMATTMASRLLANWPAQGASLVVVGSYVEGFGAYAVFNPSTGVAGEWPAFACTIVPADGLPVEDSGDLSIQQLVGVPPFTAAVLPAQATMDTDLNPPLTPLAATMDPIPVPAAPWGCIMTAIPIGTLGNAVTFSVGFFDGAPSIEVRDDEIFDAATLTWSPLVGNLGVAVGGDNVTAPSVAEIETEINSSGSLLAQVTTPDPVPGKVFDMVTMDGVTAIGSFSGGVDAAASQEGGAVYVPDFARRVRVVLVTADANYPEANNFRVPLTGDPQCQLVWYDDRGNVVDAAIQDTSAAATNAPPTWHPVPGRAVMLGIYSPDGTELVPLQALVHWRIAP